MQIAFIGLGNMGGHMAANLVKAGHGVRAFDLDAGAVARVAEQGASAASSVADAVQGAQIVITMLPAGPHVLRVCFGEDGVAAHAAPGALFVDCSTIAVTHAREAGEKAAAAGFSFVDAPVSGGVAAAEAGTLTFMAGGSEADFARAQPVLAAMGKNILHAGGVGNGQAAKIANNMLLGISMIATSEAFALAEKLGLDAQTFYDISSKASGQCWSMTSYCPAPGPVATSPANRDYQPGFAVAMMLKDLKLSQEAARAVGFETPLGRDAEAIYDALSKDGHAGMDFSGVIRRIKGEI
ncbi:MAG: 3-hydroxyisobutyrate dehydrogenase [Neomegalonema sp.]|nr:3-hydroxyisobutyrate dehydrogenase [Neomegalonema sp.]